MSKDNCTGKNKDFYDLGKKMFDSIGPHIAHNPKVVGYVSKREWVGLTKQDTLEIAEKCGLADEAWLDVMNAIEAKLKEKNA